MILLHFDYPKRRISFKMNTEATAGHEVAHFNDYVRNPISTDNVRTFNTETGVSVVDLSNTVSVSYEKLEAN